MGTSETEWAETAREKAATHGGDPEEWYEIVMSAEPADRKAMFKQLMKNGPKVKDKRMKEQSDGEASTARSNNTGDSRGPALGSKIHGGPGRYGQNRPVDYRGMGDGASVKPTIRTYPDRRNLPKTVTTDEAVEHCRWQPVFEQHPAFQYETLDLYLGYDSKMSDADIEYMLELACLDTSRCKTRGDLVDMMTLSLKTSRPKKGSSRAKMVESHRQNRNGNVSGTRYANGDTNANNKRVVSGRKTASPVKARMVNVDLAAIMHGYFIGGMESAKHRTTTNVPRYHVDLDAPADERWRRIIDDFSYAIPAACQTFKKAMRGMELPDHVTDFFMSTSEASAEIAEEINAIAHQLSMSPMEVIMMQVAFEVLAGCKEVKDYEGNPSGKWDNYGCTTIIAPSKEGPPLMMRSLDWDCRALKSLIIEVDFQRDGKSVFIGTTWAGYLGLYTGLKPGGFSIGVNRRPGCNPTTPEGLAWPVGMLCRNVLSNEDSFGGAVTALASAPLIVPCYLSVAGTETGEGCTISRFEDCVDRFIILGDPAENKKTAPLRKNPTGIKFSYKVFNATVEHANTIVQGNCEHGAIFAQRQLLERIRAEIKQRAEAGERIALMSKEQLISSYLPPVTKDMQKELLINALLSSLEGGGTYTLEELWAVISTEACRDFNTLYQVSCCPRVVEYTTRARTRGGSISDGGVGLGDGAGALTHRTTTTDGVDRQREMERIRYPDGFDDTRAVWGGMEVNNTGLTRFKIAFEAVDQWHKERTYHNMHVQYLLQESGDEDCIGVEEEEIMRRHYLQVQDLEKKRREKRNASTLSKRPITATDETSGEAYRASMTSAAAGGNRALHTPRQVEKKEVSAVEAANKTVAKNHKATLAALRGQKLGHADNRGMTWKQVKESRKPSSGMEHPDAWLEDPRWPMAQVRDQNQDAAGRPIVMRHLKNKSPGRKYRFGGDVEPQAGPNEHHRLVSNWRKAPTHATHKGPSMSHAINSSGTSYAAEISTRTASPTKPRGRGTPADREGVKALQEGRHADDGVREYEKSLLTLCYHGRVNIYKGGKQGASVTPEDIAEGFYRIGDNDWVDYGVMKAQRQAQAVFGSDPYRSYLDFPVGAAGFQTMRPHSGRRSDLGLREDSKSQFGLGYGGIDGHGGYRQTLPYQTLSSYGRQTPRAMPEMDPHPHNAGTVTSSYQYRAPPQEILEPEPIQPVVYREEEPVRGHLVRQYSGPGHATAGGVGTHEGGITTSYLETVQPSVSSGGY